MTSNTNNTSDPTYLLEEDMIIKDKWKILNFIAKGGKGEVYLAQQLNLDRKVALKIMSQEFLQSLEDDEEEITSETMRFRREVQVMARMHHPNILQVYDFDQLEMNGVQMDYIVMEYVPGPTLRQKMPEEGLGHDENKVKTWLKKYFFPILEGMKAVHEKGVVHRDMKPGNVLIDDGLPKIMDFGVAGGYHLDNVTQTHHMLGTITYMPEEQFVDLALTDVRVDVYALGKIIYEVVEGKMKKGRDKPFNSVSLDNPQTRFFKMLDRIIQQATAKDRNKRIPSVKALHDSLEELVMDSDKKRGPVQDSSHKFWKYLLIAGIISAAIFAGSVIRHHYVEKTKVKSDLNRIQNQEKTANPADLSLSLTDFKFKRPRPTLLPENNESKMLPPTILASDTMTMVLVPPATVTMSLDDPAAPGRTRIEKKIFVNPLYMDKTKITNHLYVQFLNEVDGITVKNDSVLRNGQLLLLLGEIREGYEPITFKDGTFRVRSDAVANPVVRVTPVGALTYAYFYGKSLPLMEQWWLAVQTGHDQDSPEQSSVSSRSYMDGWMMNDRMINDPNVEPEPLEKPKYPGLQPVTQGKVNRAGIQGLEQNVNEWTMGFSANGNPEFHIHGGVGELDHREAYLKRQLWEAFSSVGFRTILEIDRKK